MNKFPKIYVYGVLLFLGLFLLLFSANPAQARKCDQESETNIDDNVSLAYPNLRIRNGTITNCLCATNCTPGQNSMLQIIRDPVESLEYKFDGTGSWIPLAKEDWTGQWWLNQSAGPEGCLEKNLTSFSPASYIFSFNAPIDSLSVGEHTITFRASYDQQSGKYYEGGTETFTIAANVDLKVNDSNGPIAIPSGSSAALTWTSANLGSNPSCVASGSWSGDRPTTGFESTGVLTTPQTYTLTCSGGDGSASDTVRVNISNSEQGVVAVRATLDGVSWTGDVSYTLSGPLTINGTATPTDHYNVPIGTYTLSLTSGGPANSSLISITPASSLLVLKDQTTTFTLNFQTIAPTPATEHKACDSSKHCVTVSGTGPDQCINDTSCNLPPQGFVCNFTWSPESPKAKATTDFLDYTQTEEGTTLRSWQWTFEDATPQTSTNQNPTGVTFNSIGEKTVTLQATNSRSETCTLSQEITVQSLSPKWIEVVPR